MLSPEILAQVKVTAAALWQEERTGLILQKVNSWTPQEEIERRDAAYFLACRESEKAEQKLLAMVFAEARVEVPSS